MADVYSLAKSSWWHLVDALQAALLWFRCFRKLNARYIKTA